MKRRRELEQKLQEIKFAMIELALFLDVNPKNKKAFECFRDMAEKYKALHKEFVEKYGPITWADTAEKDTWTWVDEPWPWEFEG